MIKILFVFLLMFGLLLGGILWFENLSKSDKKVLLKFTVYSIICTVLAMCVLIGIYLFF